MDSNPPASSLSILTRHVRHCVLLRLLLVVLSIGGASIVVVINLIAIAIVTAMMINALSLLQLILFLCVRIDFVSSSLM